ncbi:TPA: hypothetical protein N0F65_001061 [Lagenidium giganteum]|uniref:Barwin domain-containing protein n=1 Tax=Lagenidium giganteum TaxID=4803 RepID=A0AAV2YNP9_9STRA|nr:TPA: hypothetical protein N0F65_001061 [Lagenidium giganteum]
MDVVDSATPATSGATYHLYDGVLPSADSMHIPGELKCGDRVRVTNKNDGGRVVVQVVDSGGARGFDLSKQAFDMIDTNKDGYKNGNLDIE